MSGNTGGRESDSKIIALVKYFLSLKADKTEIPSLSGYATETWVTGKGYQTATQVQTAIDTALAAIPSAESEAF